MCFSGIAVIIASTMALGAAPVTASGVFSEFDNMLGSWEGSYAMRFTHDGPEYKLTSVMTTTKILDEHFIQKDARVDMQDRQQPTSLNRVIYVYDRHSKSYVSFGMNNMGTTGYYTLYWTPDGKAIAGGTLRGRDGPITSISVAEYGRDRAESNVQRSNAGGPFFPFATTSHKRSDKSVSISEIRVESAPVLPVETVLHGQCGTWRLTGTMRSNTDGPTIAIDAQVEVVSILGGHATMWTIEGKSEPESSTMYRSICYVVWDKEANCYNRLTLENSGKWRFSKGSLVGERKMVFAGTNFQNGVPNTFRTIYEWSDDGKTAKLTSDGCSGDAPPASHFDFEMTRTVKAR